MELEQNKGIENNLEEEIKQEQKNFLETNIGQAINTGIDFGLKAILPDFIEEDIIEVKDALFQAGFKEATNTAIKNSINLGKSFLGIFTGNFENISQIKTAIEKGGLIDSMSDALDIAIDWAKKEKYISSSLSKVIKSGKNQIMKSIKNGVENNLEDQVEAIEKIDGYINKWEKYYKEQDFSNMEYQYKKIEEYLEKTIPLEKTIKRAREVQNIHSLIKNKGKDFHLTEEEQALTKLLV